MKAGESPLRLIYQARVAPAMRVAPAGPIKSYKSTLQVKENDQVVQTRTIEVNSPFSYKGYTFYQSGYNPQDLAWTSLQVVRDPGVPVVYAGFLLMIAGLFIVFYLNPWMASSRRKASAGSVEAVTEMGRPISPALELATRTD